MDLHNRIKTIRTKEGLTQEEFAAKLGISRGNYSQIELGRQNPTLEIIAKIARNYNVTYAYLIDGDSKINTAQVNEPIIDYSNQNCSEILKENQHLKEEIYKLQGEIAGHEKWIDMVSEVFGKGVKKTSLVDKKKAG